MKTHDLTLLAFSVLAALSFSGCGLFAAPGADCNPLGGGAGEDCLLPFPSTFQMRPDPSSPTGLRVAIPQGAVPAALSGGSLLLSEANGRDGFSPATSIVAYFPHSLVSPGVLDESLLPGPAQIAASLEADSTVVLLRHDTGERVPLFAEMDGTANPFAGDRQALLIHPAQRLLPRTRYVVALRGLRYSDGGAVAPLQGFAALRDGQGHSDAAVAARMEEIFAFLGQRGIARGDLQLAWDFVTGSDEPLTGRMVRMRDETLRLLAAGDAPAPFHIDTVREAADAGPGLLRELVGTFSAPSYLEEDQAGKLLRGPDGEPRVRGFANFPVAIHVPLCARTATGPLPVMIYGHGSFGTGWAEISDSYNRDMSNRLCMIQVATDWLGRAEADLPGFIQAFTSDFDHFAYEAERLQQAHVNIVALARHIRSGALGLLPQLQWEGRALADGSHLYYQGISEGGIQGATALALSTDLDRGVLNVPCGFWGWFFQRSSDAHPLYPLLVAAVPDAVDRQMLFTLMQPAWDYTDPATYAPHLLHDRLPGTREKRVLYQEGVGDASVPNQQTRTMVRTMDLPMMHPPAQPVFGVREAASPLSSAYVQFDVGSHVPDRDVPPPVTPVHHAIRLLPANQEQIRLFLREDGQVEDTCGGAPCVFPMPSESK